MTKLFTKEQPKPEVLDPVGKMPREMQGKGLDLVVTIAYPGSTVTDVAIGGSIYKILNSDLAKAVR